MFEVMIKGSTEHWTVGGTRDTSELAVELETKLADQGFETYIRTVRRRTELNLHRIEKTKLFANN